MDIFILFSSEGFLGFLLLFSIFSLLYFKSNLHVLVCYVLQKESEVSFIKKWIPPIFKLYKLERPSCIVRKQVQFLD